MFEPRHRGPEIAHVDDLAALVTDEMLRVFAVEAPLDGLRAALDERYAGLLDRIAPYVALERRTTREELGAFPDGLRVRS